MTTTFGTKKSTSTRLRKQLEEPISNTSIWMDRLIPRLQPSFQKEFTYGSGEVYVFTSLNLKPANLDFLSCGSTALSFYKEESSLEVVLKPKYTREIRVRARISKVDTVAPKIFVD